jgi:hypothetical protein
VSELEDRAREALDRDDSWRVPALNTFEEISRIMTDFAVLEREAAVREFVEKVRSDAALTNHFWIAAIEEAYREMFGKDL